MSIALCLVPTDLAVPIHCCGSGLQIHPFQDGVFSIPFFDVQHSQLHVSLPFQLNGIGKQITLLESFFGYIVEGKIDPSKGSGSAHNSAVQVVYCVHNFSCRTGRRTEVNAAVS